MSYICLIELKLCELDKHNKNNISKSRIDKLLIYMRKVINVYIYI